MNLRRFEFVSLLSLLYILNKDQLISLRLRFKYSNSCIERIICLILEISQENKKIWLPWFHYINSQFSLFQSIALCTLCNNQKYEENPRMRLRTFWICNWNITTVLDDIFDSTKNSKNINQIHKFFDLIVQQFFQNKARFKTLVPLRYNLTLAGHALY